MSADDGAPSGTVTVETRKRGEDWAAPRWGGTLPRATADARIEYARRFWPGLDIRVTPVAAADGQRVGAIRL